jgi:uncharacterized protein YggE
VAHGQRCSADGGRTSGKTNDRKRAQSAAQGFAAAGWRAGRITIQTNDYGRPQPMFRAATAADARAAPVTEEGGMSDVTVTVSGEAILDTARPAR